MFLNVGNANIPTAFVLGAFGGLIAGYVFFGVLFHSARTGQDELPNYREQYAAQMAAREKRRRRKNVGQRRQWQDGGALMKAVWVETF